MRYTVGISSSVKNASAALILVYRNYIAAHDRVETVEDPGAAGWGLWSLDEHTLMCSFRLCNFIKARLAPQERWNAVMRYIFRWLLQIDEDLQRFRVENGGYREWDTDYKAAFSRGVGSECSLLAENGDPVIDLLYSNNWLPLGFAHAYRVTGDKRFLSDFKGVANMLMQAQPKSNEPHLDGAWTRAYDYSKNEPYGVPHDAGWGPCCMESGWINGEILIGLPTECSISEKN